MYNGLKLVLDAHATLGEGAFWDYANQRLLWVDIEKQLLKCYVPSLDQNKSFKMPSRIGTVVPVDSQHVIVALENGIYRFNLFDSTLTLVAQPDPINSQNRFNDGKCDPSGRLWAGTMSLHNKPKDGALYMLNNNHKLELKIDDVGISNGIVWSIDKTKLYYIDTPTQQVVEYKYDDKSGAISNPRIAVQIPDSLGHPDGSTIDENGNIWVALWGGSAVTCWNPNTGQLLQKIKIPAKNITSCAFGGEQLDELYITTAAMGMSAADRERYPNAGGVFKVKPGVKGVKAFYFKEKEFNERK